MSRSHESYVKLMRVLAVALVAFFAAGFFLSLSSEVAFAQQPVPPELRENPVEGAVPGGTLGNEAQTEIWRSIRQGEAGRTGVNDPRAGQLMQSEGDNWRAWRNGPLSVYGIWGLLGMTGLLALFFLLRGRIRLDHGPSGRTITRFNTIERMAHWLLAVSFIILGLTGLNLLYGRYVLPQIMGPEAFAMLTYWGKLSHNYVAFAFMVGLAAVLVLWVAQNLPNRHDLIWVLKGGGMFSKGVHPPAKKFNAGQKVMFWLVILGGVSISLSGIALMFPFEFALFAKTFAFLNLFGLDLPTNLSPMQEMQYAQIWHAMMGLFLLAVILAHIYIGTIGMEGAFDAMATGEVDLNWARAHHSLWVDEVEGNRRRRDDGEDVSPTPQPAE